MRSHNYIIGTGFRNRQGALGDALAWYYDIWMQNTLRHTDPMAIYIMAGGDGRLPNNPLSRFAADGKDAEIFWIDILGDLGHIGMLLSGQKPYQFCGWTIDLLTLCLLAYENECDLIFKEQDVLAFGNWVDQMYNDIGTHGCIFGKSKFQASANSLMLIRHSFLCEFVRLYLGTGKDADKDNLGEAKIAKLQQQYPNTFCQYGFGVDRERPFDVKSTIWYGQKFTRAELIELRDAKLIHFEGNPPDAITFSNC